MVVLQRTSPQRPHQTSQQLLKLLCKVSKLILRLKNKVVAEQTPDKDNILKVSPLLTTYLKVRNLFHAP